MYVSYFGSRSPFHPTVPTFRAVAVRVGAYSWVGAYFVGMGAAAYSCHVGVCQFAPVNANFCRWDGAFYGRDANFNAGAGLYFLAIAV